MAGLKFGNVIKATTTTKLERKLSDAAMKIMRDRLFQAKLEIEEAVIKLIKEAVTNSPVYKGLDGNFSGAGGDLQAELGLTRRRAKNALEQLLEILSQTVHLETTFTPGSRSKATVRVKALNSNEYEGKLKNGRAFHYPSKNEYKVFTGEVKGGKRVYQEVKTEFDIRWMEWLLEAASDIMEQQIPNIKEYGIDFNLSPARAAKSRSGRALMTRRTRRPGWRPYVLPRIALPNVKGSKNFIEDIALSRKFSTSIRNIVKKILQGNTFTISR